MPGPDLTIPLLEELFSLKGKIAVVLGGTSGIGLSISRAFAKAGARAVISSSRSAELVEHAAGELAGLGCQTLAATSDVQDRDSLVRLRDSVLAQFGQVDILLVAAGINMKLPSLAMAESDFARVIDTNLTGTFRANQVFGESMVARRKGSIINIASIASFHSILEMTAYSASKSGVISITESLAFEWARHEVRVNAIAPGSFRTALSSKFLATPGRLEYLLSHIPAQRLGELSELTGAAIYLASDGASFVTGETIVIDGGLLLNGI